VLVSPLKARALGHGLAAYAVGAGLGTIPLLLDWAFRGGVISLRSLAGYSLLGGLAAALPDLLVIALRGGESWFEAVACAFASFLTLEVLYLINVALLPNQGALAPLSILWDLVAVGVSVVGVWLAVRVQRRLAPSFGARLLPLVGGTLVAGAALQIVEIWPFEPGIPHRQGEGPNLVLVVIDAGRRDHLGLYGYGRATSRRIDAWTPRARVYDRALAASSWTLNDVPVMLGSRSGEPGEHPVLDELKGRGYVVACFSDNPLLERDGPLSKGFDYVGQSTGAALRMLRTLYAETFVGEYVVLWPWLARRWDDSRLVDEALRWAGGVEGPFLLYVHLMDAHMPYRRPAIDGRGWRQRRLESLRTGMKVSPEEASDIIAHYDGGLRSADDAADRVLKAAETWRRSYVAIVTADHGESLGEGGRWGHGKTLAPELVDVPLLVVGDGVRPGRVETAVGHASVAQTLLRAAGVPTDARGVSDLRTSDGDAVVDGFLPPRWSYRVARGYQAVTDADRGETKLFDLLNDPHRERDLSRVHPKLAHELAAEPSNGSATAPNSGILERLRALGYIDE
jgi:hypothetical protein